jgi:hypothetical protein
MRSKALMLSAIIRFFGAYFSGIGYLKQAFHDADKKIPTAQQAASNVRSSGHCSFPLTMPLNFVS